MILENLQKHALSKAQDRTVAEVRIGLCYTAVQLNSGEVGVALTFRNTIGAGCDGPRETQAGTAVEKILESMTSGDLYSRTVGIATANALINRDAGGFSDGDVLDMMGLRKDDSVAMVGYFGPVVPELRERVGEVRIFEKKEMGMPDVYPEAEAFDYLRNCSAALITSTSIINNTIDSLLEAAGNCRMVALAGASTPLAPEVFAGYRVSVLSGVLITDAAGILRVVSEGGGMRRFREHVKKVNAVCA